MSSSESQAVQILKYKRAGHFHANGEFDKYQREFERESSQIINDSSITDIHADIMAEANDDDLPPPNHSIDYPSVAYAVALFVPLFQGSKWSSTALMSTKQNGLSQSTLADDRVLVCGGHDGDNYLNIAEIYDLSANQWSSTASMSTKRNGPSQSTLAYGRVLVYCMGVL